MLRFGVKPTITEKREGGERENREGNQSCFLLEEMTPGGSSLLERRTVAENFFFTSSASLPVLPPLMLLIPEGSVAPGLTLKVKVISL